MSTLINFRDDGTIENIMIGEDDGDSASQGKVPNFSGIDVLSSPTLLFGAKEHRALAVIYNNGSQIVYLGKGLEMNVNESFPLPPGATYVDQLTSVAYWGMTISGTSNVRIVEVE